MLGYPIGGNLAKQIFSYSAQEGLIDAPLLFAHFHPNRMFDLFWQVLRDLFLSAPQKEWTDFAPNALVKSRIGHSSLHFRSKSLFISEKIGHQEIEMGP